MRTHRSPVNCIVPPHIAKALAKSKDPRIREFGLRTLEASTRIRGRREILRTVRMAVVGPTAQKHRTTYDAQHGTNLPGTPIRDGGESQPHRGDS